MELIVMAKGRKRKDGPREPNGRLQRSHGPDRGTEELQRRRAWLTQNADPARKDKRKPGDPTKASYPLGVMLANEIIDDATHNAASRFAWLNAVVYGRMSYAAIRYDDAQRGRGGYEANEEWLSERKAELERAERAVQPRQAYDALLSLVVFERAPRWLLPVVPAPRDITDSRRLLKALDDLAIALGVKTKRAA